MLLVADTSPLIVLAKLNRLDLLKAEYDDVFVPFSVFQEGVEVGQRLGAVDASVIQQAVTDGTIKVMALQQAIPDELSGLGQGERECIYLALELGCSAVLMDDFNARRAAQMVFAREGRNIAVRGTLGLIAGAVKAGYLPMQDAIMLITELRDRDDIWISPVLCDQVLVALRTG